MRAAALLALAVLSASLAPPARPALVEEVVRLPARLEDQPGARHDVTLVLTVFRDDARMRSPFVVLSHGRADAAGRAAMGRARYADNAAWFVKRGFAVVVPTRSGYGVTGGPDIERPGPCATTDHARRFAVGGGQVAAALDWTRSQPWADPDRGLLVGQSFGGAASLALAARSPAGIVGVMNFAGGAGGAPATSPEKPCQPEKLAEAMSAFGETTRVPALWLYSENDRYWGPRLPRLWFEEFRERGGHGRFVALPPLPGADGHGIFTAMPEAWHPAVDAFLRHLGFLP